MAPRGEFSYVLGVNKRINFDYSYKKQLVQNCFVCCSLSKDSWDTGYGEQMTSLKIGEF
jgi:hypothetical protein